MNSVIQICQRFHLGSAFAFITLLLGCDPLPIQITKGPYPQNVTQTSITILWETNRAGVSQIRYTSANGDQRQVTDAKHVRIHKVRLEELEPHTHYTYEVASGFDSAEGFFRTAVGPGTPFRFVVYGNAGTAELHRRLAEPMGWAAPHFILNTGSLAGPEARSEDWERNVFQPLAGLIDHVPFYPCVGDHVTRSKDYDHFFASPTNLDGSSGNPRDSESWYTFRYGNARFIALDSTRNMDECGPGSPQYVWLEQQLNDRTELWTCVYFYHAPYSSGESGSAIGIREAWGNLFMKHSVDLVFSGHDPIYERTYPISHRQDLIPVTYVVTGGGRVAASTIQPHVWTAYSDSARHFLVVEIDHSRLDLIAYRDDGQVLDTLTIHKQDGQASHELEPLTAEQIQLEQYLQTHLELPFLPIADAEEHQTLAVGIRNPLATPITMTAHWDPLPGSAWSIKPNSTSVALKGGQEEALQFQVRLDPQQTYPSPTFKLHYLASFGEGEVQGPSLRAGVERRLACPRIRGPIETYGQTIEPAWRQAARTTDAFLHESLSGQAQFDTQVQIGHDEAAFYIAFELADPRPDQLSTHLAGKIDLKQDDAVGVYLGSPDGEAWLFTVNAKGVQCAKRNGTIVPGVRWAAGTARYQDHWTVETRIPFACFAMPPSTGQTWGIQLFRNSRLEGRTLWSIGRQEPSLGILEIK